MSDNDCPAPAPSYDDLVCLVRSALNHLYDPYELRRNPLVELLGVGGRHDTPTVLQRLLTEAIQALEPGPDEPPQSRRWRIYEVLFYQYVRRLEGEAVADQMGISGRQLAGLEALVDHLCQAYLGRTRAEGTDGPAEAPPESTSSTVDAAQPSQDLAWLRELPPDTATSLDEAVSAALQLVQVLAHSYGVAVLSDLEQGLPPLAVPPVALRQMLFNLLNVAIPRARAGRVCVSAQVVRWEVALTVRCDDVPAGPPLSAREERGLALAGEMARLCRGGLRVARGEEPFAATLTLPALGQVPVLLVDDNADALQLLQRYAAGTRYRIIATREPRQALPLAHEIRPQAIVLDVMMPEVDGWDILGQLRRDAQTRDIPVVVCTILPQEELVRSFGVEGFLLKPVSRRDLLAALDGLQGLPG